MAISMGSEEDAPMSEINTTPLVDVMLVMLIIFLLTIPAVLDTIPVKLPPVIFDPTQTKPENVLLTVRAENDDGTGACKVYWGNSEVDSTRLLELGQAKLETLIADVGGAENITDETMPEVHIRGDIMTPYKCIGGVIYTMQFAGYQRIGFISEPAPGSATVPRL